MSPDSGRHPGVTDEWAEVVHDADPKAYFDTIPHNQLLKAVGMRVSDRQVLHLLRMWLEADVIETDAEGRSRGNRPGQGTPQRE